MTHQRGGFNNSLNMSEPLDIKLEPSGDPALIPHGVIIVNKPLQLSSWKVDYKSFLEIGMGTGKNNKFGVLSCAVYSVKKMWLSINFYLIQPFQFGSFFFLHSPGNPVENT